jgi:hypothetical protein
MPGPLTPVALLPRFSSFLGSGSYLSVPMNVEGYAKGTMTVWRGQQPGTSSPSFNLFFEDSHDAVTWSSLNGSGTDPGASNSTIVRFDLARRWLRVRVELTGTDTGITCWAVGLLEQRTGEA